MNNSITIKLDDDLNLYKKSRFTITPNQITVLIGPNGTGKTAFLNYLARYLKKNNIDYAEWSNLIDGGSNGKSAYGFHDQYEDLALSIMNSEGQEIGHNWGSVFIQNRMVSAVKSAKSNNRNQIWFLLDCLDSGMDIKNLDDVIWVLTKYMKDINSLGIDVFTVLTSNSFELVKDHDCIYPYTMKHHKFTDYEVFRSFIKEQWDIIDNRDRSKSD